MNKDLTVFSVYHKEFAIPASNFIQPIQVGKYYSGLDLSFKSDDVGDNIADKNQTFSELTALYWIWKNLDKIDSKYIGLCHYRRYFTLAETRIKKKLFSTKVIADIRDVYFTPFSNEALASATGIEIKNTLLQELNLGKTIVPMPAILQLEMGYSASIKMHYIYFHVREDWYLMRTVVTRGDEDKEKEFDDFFDNETKMCCYNMFISDKYTFKQYCEWLFPILFELEKIVKLSGYVYQRRIFGFFSERLFNFFIYKNKIETAEFPVVSFT